MKLFRGQSAVGRPMLLLPSDVMEGGARLSRRLGDGRRSEPVVATQEAEGIGAASRSGHCCTRRSRAYPSFAFIPGPTNTWTIQMDAPKNPTH